MEYRACGKRCAVMLGSLHLPISNDEVLAILHRKGFRVIEVDIVSLARKCVGTSRYRRGARLFEAPAVVDCSSFMKWLYAQRGIWLARRSIQQSEYGEAIGLGEIIQGDLGFTSGRIDYYQDNPSNGIGHVGIATGEGTVIHAANKKVNIVESPLNTFVGKTDFRCARRYIPKDSVVITLEIPDHREVEI